MKKYINIKYIYTSLSFIIPFAAYLVYNLNHFYDHGSYLMDDGWFAFLATHSFSIPLKNPEVFGGTFFSVHMSPFFYILSFIYQFFSNLFSEVTFFSLYLAFIYACLGFATFNISTLFLDTKKHTHLLLSLIVSIVTVFNGVMLSAIGFPHIELGIPILILLFLSLYYTGYIKSSLFAVLFLILIREDSGLHLFAVIFLLQIAQYIKTKSFDPVLIKIMLFAIIYAFFIMLIQHTYFHSNTLERVYLGNPHFAHLTFDFLKDRIAWILGNKAFLIYPFVFLLGLSLLFRNIFLAIGVITIAPWILLSLIAISYQAGTFHNYYAFPFILLVSWPTFAYAIMYKITSKINFKHYLISILFVTVLSIYLFPGSAGSHDPKPWKSFGLEFMNNIDNTDKFIKYIKNNIQDMDNLYVDDHVAPLMTDALIKGKTWMGWNVKSENYINKDIDYLIFFNKGNTKVFKEIAISKHLDYVYHVPYSYITVVSKSPMKETTFLKHGNATLVSWTGNELPHNKDVGKNIGRDKNAIKGRKGFLTFGPYIKLPSGVYTFTTKYKSSESNSTLLGYWDVGCAIPTGMDVFRKGKIYGSNGLINTISASFQVPKEYDNHRIEIRNYYNGSGDLTIKSLTITRIK